MRCYFPGATSRNGQRQCGDLSVYRPPLPGKIAFVSPVKIAFQRFLFTIKLHPDIRFGPQTEYVGVLWINLVWNEGFELDILQCFRHCGKCSGMVAS